MLLKRECLGVICFLAHPDNKQISFCVDDASIYQFIHLFMPLQFTRISTPPRAEVSNDMQLFSG